MKFLINFVLFVTLCSCQLQDTKNIDKNSIKKIISKAFDNDNNKIQKDPIKYVLGERYFIEGVEYIPEENYEYNEIGLATFYGKELHNKKTLNNDFNKVTELLGRHKTLPLPSIVKVTNLDNGLFLTIKINDRHDDNSSLIQLSRKSAMLLKFYKNKIAKVRIEVMSDPSKQMKVVSKSMSELDFIDTVDSAPTESVFISNIDDDLSTDQGNTFVEQPVEIGFENITNDELYLKVYEFKTYNDLKIIIADLNISSKITIQKNINSYSVIIGPLNNTEANKLVLSFISKGYKKTKFILE
jgi:rare lipoprotein A